MEMLSGEIIHMVKYNDVRKLFYIFVRFSRLFTGCIFDGSIEYCNILQLVFNFSYIRVYIFCSPLSIGINERKYALSALILDFSGQVLEIYSEFCVLSFHYGEIFSDF